MRYSALPATLVVLSILAACAEGPVAPEPIPFEAPAAVLANLGGLCPPGVNCDGTIGCDEDEQDCQPELPCVVIGPTGPLPCPDEPATFELTEGKVTGHGVYAVEDRTLSFSFHAMSDGSTVRGNFEFHERPRGPRWHGEITCLQVDGAKVFLEGVVGQSRGGGPAVGNVVAWASEDNGAGRTSAPDRVSDPEVTSEGGAGACGTLPGNEPVEIRGGNIQVH